MNKPKYDGIKVFSATMHKDRDVLGDRVTEWIRANPKLEIVDTVTNQSSDQAYHCLTITIFFVEVKPSIPYTRPEPTAMPGSPEVRR